MNRVLNGVVGKQDIEPRIEIDVYKYIGIDVRSRRELGPQPPIFGYLLT